MRFPPWLLSFVVGTTLVTAAGSALAEQETSANSEQHQALDDAALEEKYGIKAGAVQRDEQPASDTSTAEEADAEESSDTSDATSSDADSSTDTESASADTESTSTNADSEDTEGGTGGTGSAEDAIQNGEDEQSNDDNE